MSSKTWIRQSHRWLGVLFTLTVLVDIVAVSLQGPLWVFYLPLLPLVLQLLSGMYLFVLPYVAKRRGQPRTVAET